MSSNYPNGFASGVTIRGIPLQQMHPGEVFWVNNSSVLAYGQSVNGSNGNDGSFARPFSTITYALTQCTANRGDIIALGVGHNDSLAAGGAGALTLNVAGVAIVGTGVGSLRSAITSTGTTDTIVISAANMSFSNISFEAAVAEVATGLDVSAVDGLSFDNCYFVASDGAADTYNYVNVIDLATGADNFSMSNCKFFGRDTNNNACIIGVAHDRFYLDNCQFFNTVAPTATGTIQLTGNVTNMEVKNCNFYSNVDGAVCMKIDGTACTGVVKDTHFASADAAGFAAGAADATGAHFFNCMGSGDVNGYGIPVGGDGAYVNT